MGYAQKETCGKCGAFLLKHRFKNGRSMIYCSNDACETRIDHPINKELEKIRQRLAAKEAKAKETEGEKAGVKAKHARKAKAADA